jgi:molybdopterin synthase sulfur carrier subunit
MRVLVPSQLRRYTAGRAEVEATGRTLDEVLHDLDRQFPGLRFRVIDERDRVRPFIVLFLGGERHEDLATAVRDDQELYILGALSGG